MIVQAPKQVTRLPDRLHCIVRVSIETIRYTKQVKRFSHSSGILLLFKQVQRLLMCIQSLLNSPGVHQPVPQPIQAAGTQGKISKLLGKEPAPAQPFYGLAE